MRTNELKLRSSVLCVLLGVAVVGCGELGSDAGAEEIGDESEGGGDDLLMNDSGEGEPEPGDETDEGEAESETGEPAPLEPCTGVDLLFVVDNSDSMAEEQAKLLASAAGFVAELGAMLPEGASVHVGVIPTDSSELERQGPGGPCNFAATAPFIVHAGALTPELDAGLGCALSLGTAGDPDERPIEHALAALSPAANLPEGPNPGFVREDAALILVMVTDEEDDHEAATQWGSAGDPQDWVDELIELRGGVEERIAVLGLVGHDKPNACPGFQWDGSEGAELAPRLLEFTQSFTHHEVGDVCGTSYGDFFADALPTALAACGG